MAALTLRIPPLEARREPSESALTLRIPPLEARREIETVKTTPVAYDPPMAALTLRIPPREARWEAEAPEKPLVLRLPAPSQSQSQFRPQPQSSAGSTSKSQQVESSSGKLCYKCNKPLPNVKWPWKRCLECRLSAERLAQESTAAHATGRKVRKPRVKCTICTGLTTTPPLCQPCRKLGITGPLSDAKRARTQSSTTPTSSSHIDRPPKRHKPNNLDRQRPRPTPITPIIAEYGKAHSQIFDTLVPLQYSTSNDSALNSNAANFVSPDWPLDRIIDKLATAKHFNERGEYIFPQFLPPESLARVQNENTQILQPTLFTPTPTSSSTSSFSQVCRSPSCGQPLDSKDTKRKLCKQCVAQIMGDAKLYDRDNEVKPTPSSLAMALVFPDTTKVKTKTATPTPPTTTTTTTTSATVGQSKTIAFETKGDLERSSVPTPTPVIDLTPTTTTTTTAPETTVAASATTTTPISEPVSGYSAAPPTSTSTSTPAITTIDPSMLMLQPPSLPTQGLFPTSIPFPTPPPSSRRASPESEEGVDEVRGGGDDTEDESGVDEGEGEGEGVPGWDSELTELTESEGDEDEGESEVDVPLKDATTSQTTTATASTSISTSSSTQPLRIKLPAHTTVYRKRKPAHVCQKSTCQNLLTRSARWKMCLGCRIRVREYERARRGGYAKWLRSDGEDDEVEEMRDGGVERQGNSEMLVLFGGRRKCAIRTCTEIIPPLTTYRWKLCEGCRQRTRRRARELKHGAPLRSDCEDDDEEEMPLKEKLAMKKRIQSLKGLKLTFKGRTVASVDTRAQEAAMGLSVDGEGEDKAMALVGKDVKVKREVVVRSMLKPDNLERAPLYQTFETLLEDLHHLLSTYVKAHDMYVVMQLCRTAAASNDSNTTSDVTKDDPTASKHADFIARNTAPDKPQKNLKALPAMFSFSGEFSVVADPAGGDVGLHIETVQTLLGHYLGISLTRAGLTVDPAGTVTAAYNCSHEAVVNIPPGLFPLTPAPTPNPASAGKNSPSNPPPPPAVLRKLNGELNIVISWDRSHVYFPGMRTVVSFCLIG